MLKNEQSNGISGHATAEDKSSQYIATVLRGQLIISCTCRKKNRRKAKLQIPLSRAYFGRFTSESGQSIREACRREKRKLSRCSIDLPLPSSPSPLYLHSKERESPCVFDRVSISLRLYSRAHHRALSRGIFVCIREKFLPGL